MGIRDRFWSREVYENMHSNYNTTKGTSPKGAKANTGKGKPSTSWQTTGKGPTGKGGKGFGKGSKSESNNAKWANTAPNGKQYCRNYHNARCSGGCGRSHACPVLTDANTPCNQNHLARESPHAKKQ